MCVYGDSTSLAGWLKLARTLHLYLPIHSSQRFRVGWWYYKALKLTPQTLLGRNIASIHDIN